MLTSISFFENLKNLLIFFKPVPDWKNCNENKRAGVWGVKNRCYRRAAMVFSVTLRHTTPLIKKLGFGLHGGKARWRKLMWQDLGANCKLAFKCGRWSRPLLSRCGHQDMICEGCAEEGPLRPAGSMKKFFETTCPRTSVTTLRRKAH